MIFACIINDQASYNLLDRPLRSDGEKLTSSQLQVRSMEERRTAEQSDIQRKSLNEVEKIRKSAKNCY